MKKHFFFKQHVSRQLNCPDSILYTHCIVIQFYLLNLTFVLLCSLCTPWLTCVHLPNCLPELFAVFWSTEVTYCSCGYFINITLKIIHPWFTFNDMMPTSDIVNRVKCIECHKIWREVTKNRIAGLLCAPLSLYSQS